MGLRGKDATETVLNVAMFVYYVLLIVYLVDAATNTVPMSARLWHGVFSACYKLAESVGRMGLYAEAAYWQVTAG